MPERAEYTSQEIVKGRRALQLLNTFQRYGEELLPLFPYLEPEISQYRSPAALVTRELDRLREVPRDSKGAPDQRLQFQNPQTQAFLRNLLVIDADIQSAIAQGYTSPAELSQVVRASVVQVVSRIDKEAAINGQTPVYGPFTEAKFPIEVSSVNSAPQEPLPEPAATQLLLPTRSNQETPLLLTTRSVARLDEGNETILQSLRVADVTRDLIRLCTQIIDHSTPTMVNLHVSDVYSSVMRALEEGENLLLERRIDHTARTSLLKALTQVVNNFRGDDATHHISPLDGFNLARADVDRAFERDVPSQAITPIPLPPKDRIIESIDFVIDSQQAAELLRHPKNFPEGIRTLITAPQALEAILSDIVGVENFQASLDRVAQVAAIMFYYGDSKQKTAMNQLATTMHHTPTADETQNQFYTAIELVDFVSTLLGPADNLPYRLPDDVQEAAFTYLDIPDDTQPYSHTKVYDYLHQSREILLSLNTIQHNQKETQTQTKLTSYSEVGTYFDDINQQTLQLELNPYAREKLTRSRDALNLIFLYGVLLDQTQLTPEDQHRMSLENVLRDIPAATESLTSRYIEASYRALDVLLAGYKVMLQRLKANPQDTLGMQIEEALLEFVDPEDNVGFLPGEALDEGKIKLLGKAIVQVTRFLHTWERDFEDVRLPEIGENITPSQPQATRKGPPFFRMGRIEAPQSAPIPTGAHASSDSPRSKSIIRVGVPGIRQARTRYPHLGFFTVADGEDHA